MPFASIAASLLIAATYLSTRAQAGPAPPVAPLNISEAPTPLNNPKQRHGYYCPDDRKHNSWASMDAIDMARDCLWDFTNLSDPAAPAQCGNNITQGCAPMYSTSYVHEREGETGVKVFM